MHFAVLRSRAHAAERCSFDACRAVFVRLRVLPRQVADEQRNFGEVSRARYRPVHTRGHFRSLLVGRILGACHRSASSPLRSRTWPAA